MALKVFERFCHDRAGFRFTGADSGTEPLTWGQKAILRDMRDSGNQFTMGGRLRLPQASTIDDVVVRVSGLIGRHAALRMRLLTDSSGIMRQEVAESGQAELHIVAMPDDADRSEVDRYAVDLMAEWPDERVDFHRDWPLRMAVVKHRGDHVHLVWALSHLVADGGAHILLLGDLLADGAGRGEVPSILDIARREQTPNVKQGSSRAMKYWESQLKSIAGQTFGEPIGRPSHTGHRYEQARFTSPAAHLAVLAIAERTGTDVSRVTLGVVATAIARVTGVNPLTIKVMVNNRFMPGMAGVIAPIAQNSVLTIDAADVSIDEVVVGARGAMLSAGMRGYYDPDELSEVSARLEAQRGFAAAVTCRINDQRVMVVGAKPSGTVGEITPQRLRQDLDETTLTWLGPRQYMHEQVNLLIENRTDVLSLHLMWDLWSLNASEVEAILRAVEEVAVEAAFDPGAQTKVSKAVRHR